MPYLNIDDGMDEHPKVDALSDAAFRALMRELMTWSRIGIMPASALGLELVRDGSVRRAPRWWLPDAIAPPLRHRNKIPIAVRYTVYDRDGWKCLHCGTGENLTLDHIVPWSLGGSDELDNLQTLCQPCNSSKGARV